MLSGASFILFAALSHTTCLSPPTPDDGTYPTFWSYSYAAHDKAKKSRTGILWWFPVKGTSDEHEIFSQEAMNELSTRIVVVNVNEKCTDKDSLRKMYSVPDKYPTFVMTDYYGNPIAAPMVLKRGIGQKVDPKKHFEKPLKNVQNWVDAQRSKLAKDIAKLEKDLKRNKYRKSIPALQKILQLKGFKAVDKAQVMMTNALDAGRSAIKKAERSDNDDAIKQLKKVVKDFADTEVEKEAKAALAKLQGEG